MSVAFEVAPDDSEFAGISIALGEFMAAVQGLGPAHRHLLQQAWQEERDQASVAYPGLARVFDSLQALVLQIRITAQEDRDG